MEGILTELELAHGIVDAIEAKQGEDIVLLDISKISVLADYFVVCSGTSERQIKALVDGVLDHAREQLGLKPRHVEGHAESGWVLIDFGGVVVHIFSAGQRSFYRLEELWKDALLILRIQ